MILSPLQDAHVASGATFVTKKDIKVPAHYGDASAEYRAVRDGVGIVDRCTRAKVCVTGSDRMRFVHGMVTNTVSDLPTGAGNHAALVTAQGQTLLDLWVHNLGDMLWLETETGQAQTLMETLDRYLIADDVTLTDETDSWGIVGLHGPQASDVLQKVLGDLPSDLPEHHTIEIDFGGAPAWMTARAYLGEPGYDLRVPSTLAPKLWDTLVDAGGRPIGFDAFEMLRIEQGLPRCGAEIDGAITPVEIGLSHTVDFDKGCYIGQEVIAKMHFRGKPRWYLVGLFCDAMPSVGQEILVDDKTIGHVTSCVQSPTFEHPIALALVRRGWHEQGQAVSLANSTTAHVTKLPFEPQ